jgi:Mce-associated membrane protein
MTLLTAAAVASAGWFGWSWRTDSHSTALATARTRDTVLASAEQSVLNFNTLNYHQASTGLKLWLDSSTGDLHTQLSQNLQQEIQLVQQKQTVTTAKILDGAVTQLDTDAGTASVMVAVAVTVTPAKGSPYTESESEVGTLTSTSAGWKLSALGYPSEAAASATPSASPSPSPSS